MGAGAGYNIKGTLELVKINSYEVGEPFDVTEKLGGDYVRKYQVFPIKCDIDCIVENVSSESYYYGGILYGMTPIKITKMSIASDFAEIEDISEVDDSVIDDALYNVTFDASLGGGWVHSTFGGDMHCEASDLKDVYADTNLTELDMYITNEDAVDALDKYATGDNYEERYSVVDIDGNIISDDFYTGELDSAISYAKENNGYQVETEKIWCTYEITNDGNVYVYDEEYDFGSVEVEWTNPDYIEE